jgi:hypothetical protein
MFNYGKGDIANIAKEAEAVNWRVELVNGTWDQVLAFIKEQITNTVARNVPRYKL